MTLKPGTLAAICLCVLLLGGFLSCRSTSHPKNTITVDVENGSSKINLAPEKGDVLDLIGWVTVDNQSGKTFTNARIKLMAGDVRKLQPDEIANPRTMLVMRSSEDADWQAHDLEHHRAAD